MAIGDVNSDQRGTGARFNDGKVPLGLVPVRYWQQVYAKRERLTPELDGILEYLIDVQEGVERPAPFANPERLVTAARVFEYGASKYAAWNWCKGMPWSVPIDCALRHIHAIVCGQDIDPESELPHIGHVYCNLIMLDWFVRNYPEGRDVIPEGAFNAAA